MKSQPDTSNQELKSTCWNGGSKNGSGGDSGVNGMRRANDRRGFLLQCLVHGGTEDQMSSTAAVRVRTQDGLNAEVPKTEC